MKSYREMSRDEVESICKRGGDGLKRLNKMVADYLDTLELSDDARAIIADTDYNNLADVFGGMFTAKEIEQYVKEEY